MLITRRPVYAQNPVIYAWILVNLLDSLLTCIALAMGATEMSLVYQATGSMAVSMAAKYLAVFLIIGMLMQIQRLKWLNWLVLGMLLVVAWNTAQILSNL